MKIFSFKRLIGAASLAGIAYYVNKNGGAKAVFGNLQSKAMDLAANAKKLMGMPSDAARDSGSDRAPAKFGSDDVDRNVERGNAASTYQSYGLSSDDGNLH